MSNSHKGKDTNNVVRDTDMDLNKLMGNATELTKNNATNETDPDLTKSVGSDWMSSIVDKPSPVRETSIPQLPTDGVSLSTNSEYTGNGMVLNNSEIDTKKETVPRPQGLASDTLSNVSEYLTEMDEDITKFKKDEEDKEIQKNTTDTTDDDEDDQMTQEEFDRTYNEAIVLIDKTGMGSVINFTDEEREKLEKVKKIRLEEVETISLKTLKTKKIKKKDNLDTILKRQVTLHSTPIVLLASGYTATIRGCSTYELMSLMRDSQNALMDTETKWTLIHSKIEDTSIGKMDYNEFLHHTSALDYNIFLYGLLCATYPDDDKITLKCEKCPTNFDHNYSVKSLIRAEKMTSDMQSRVAEIIDASHTVETAKAYHDSSPVNNTKTIKLPGSGIIAEIHVQSGYDFINKSIKELAENKDIKYNQASVLSSIVNTMYVPDPDNIDEYYEIDGAFEITKVIYSLGDTDIIVLTKQGDITLEGLSFEFGLMNIQCPNCKYQTQSLPMDLEAILFYKYQQAMSTKIE